MISIEGNIGSGKSEILSSLQLRGKDVVIIDSTLKNYEEEKSFAYFVQLILQYTNTTDKLIESSAKAHLQVFAKLLHESKKITDLQLSILCALHLELPIHEIKKIIYIDVPPEICLKRIELRGRQDEKWITLDYLKTVELYYTEYLNEMKLQNVEIIKIKLTDTILCPYSPIEISDKVLLHI